MSAKLRVVAALANARGMRRGVPPITNVVDILPTQVRRELEDDAEQVLKALGHEALVAALRDRTQAAHRNALVHPVLGACHGADWRDCAADGCAAALAALEAAEPGR